MNAAARALSHGNVFRGDISSLLPTTSQRLLALLWLVLLISGLAVIYVRNIDRALINHHEGVLSELRQLDQQRGQLLLERSMLSSPDRIQQRAQYELGMTVPADNVLLPITE